MTNKSLLILFGLISFFAKLEAQNCLEENPDYSLVHSEVIQFDDDIFKSAEIKYYLHSSYDEKLNLVLHTHLNELECYRQIGVVNDDDYGSVYGNAKIQTIEGNSMQFSLDNSSPNSSGSYFLDCSDIHFESFSDGYVSPETRLEIMLETKFLFSLQTAKGNFKARVKNSRSNDVIKTTSKKLNKPLGVKEPIYTPIFEEIPEGIEATENINEDTSLQEEDFEQKRNYDSSGDGIFGRRIVHRNIGGAIKSAKGFGRVVVSTCINRAGVPVYAEINEEETTIKDSGTLKAFLKAVYGYRYEKDSTAVEEQCGKLVFNMDIGSMAKNEFIRKASGDIKKALKGGKELAKFKSKYKGLTPQQVKNLSVIDFERLFKK